MSKFDEMYPNAQKGFNGGKIDHLPPVQKHGCEEGCSCEHKCICGEPTVWVNTTSMSYVCSTECNSKVWDSLFTAFIASQLIGG
jgi:hypothetical protein